MSDNKFKAKIEAELDTSKLEQDLNKLKNKDVKLKVDVGSAGKDIKNIDNDLKNTSKSAQKFGTDIKKSFNIVPTINITAKAINSITKAVNESVSAVKEFDKSITNLRMATGGNYKDTSNLVKGYNKMAQSLGATTTEIADGADAWLRQGHTIEDTNKLIKNSITLSKIAGLSVADSTTYLTSAMKGYKTSVEDVSKIVDKLTSVDLVSATDAAGLAEGMSRTANSANLAGISMDKLLGYLAATGEVTQRSMSTVGESFKTIFARMANIKADKLELIDEDGTVESLSDVETVLNNLDIKLRDSDNEFRNFGDVLDEVASRWSSFSTVQQGAITKALGGTRQAENVKVLMENYAKATEYMNVAANSVGTAEQKFGAYMDSIESKTKTLQASFEALAINTFSTDLIGGIIQATTSLVEFLDKTNLLKGTFAGLAAAGAIKMFTSLATGISKASIQMANFGNAMSLLKTGNLGVDEFQNLCLMTENLSKSQLKAVLSSKALSVEQRIAILTANGMSQAEAQATLASLGLATAEGAATATTFSLSAAIKGLWATLMANPLILVIAGVTAAVSAYSSYKQKVEEARQATLNAGNAAKDSASKISEMYNAYQKASQAYANNTGSKEDLTNATSALLSALGIEQSEIDELIGKYGNLDAAINAVTVDSLKKNLGELTNGYKASVDALLNTTKDGWFSSFSMLDFKTGNEIKYADILKDAGLISQGSYGSAGGAAYLGDNESLSGVIDIYQKLIDMRQTLDNAVANGAFTREELANSSLYTNIGNKLNSFSEQYSDVLDYINQINRISSEIQWIDFSEKNKLPQTQAEFENLKQSMIDTALESGQFVGSQEQIKDSVVNTLATIPELSKFFNDYSDSVENANSATKITATGIQNNMKTVADSTSKAIEGIQSVQDILNKQSTGESLSINDFNSDALKDYTSALEYHNGVMQLNADKVNEIVKAKSDEQIAINNTNKALAQSKYLQNAAEIEKLRSKIKDKNYAEGESADTIKNSIDALLGENKTIKEACNGFDLITSSLQEATSAYQHWINAQNASESGDMFDDTLDAINKINDTLNNKKSESYGRIGRTDYKAAVELIVPDSVDSSDEEKVNSYLQSIKDLFTYNDDGERSGLNIDSFCKKAVDAGLMVLDESGENYKIAGQKTMQDFADGLGLSLPLVQAMFGEMEEFGGEFDWADEAVKTIGDLAVQANESAEALRNLAGNEDLEIKLDVSDIENVDDKISTLDNTISQMNEIKAKPDVDSSEIEYANSIIEYCVAQQQNLSAPIVMSVDTSAISENTANAITILQDFQRACNELELNQKLGLDTTDAEQKVNNLATDVKSIDPTILAQLGIDTTSVETVKSSIQSITGNQLVSLGIDDSAIIGYTADDKEATVTYKLDSSAVDEYNPKNLTRTVTYNIKTKGKVDVNGTANVSGTALAGGDWSSKTGGTTLVGELGREIVVDPHTGRWYTVGDTGAEFVNIPRGAIVFNHKQSESLLTNGYVAGRATALVAGNAMVTGGIKVSNAKTSTYSGGYSTSSNTNSFSNSSSSKSSSSKNSSSSKSDKSEKSEFEKQYEYHQHLLKMEQETDAAYLDWLKGAYQDAYNSGQIELEDFYKYEEEVYQKSKDLFDDYIKDIEHKIDLFEKSFSKVGYIDTEDIISHYRDIQANVHDEAEKFRSQGLDDNSEYIQDLQKQWWDAEEKIIKSITDACKKINESIENSIELDKKHLKDIVNVYEDGSAEELIGTITSKYSAIQANLHDSAEQLRALGYAENSQEIQDLQKQWWDAEESKNDSLSEIFDRRLELSEDYIERSKILGWDIGDNEIKARERILDWISSDTYRSTKSFEEWQEAYLEELEKYNDAVMSTIDKIYSDYSDVIDEANEELDNQITREKALLDVKTKQYDAINRLAEAQHNADKAIADSRISKAYLSEREYQLIYNEEDYSRISSVISGLDSDITRITKNFNKQIENAYANGQEYLIENITAEYERQVDLKMKELAIAESELELTKKQTQLNNVLAERNIKQLVEKDGKLQWEWVADTDKVRAATEELADAEYEYQKAKTEKSQKLNLDRMQENIDDFTDEQGRNNKLVKDLGKTIGDVKKKIDDMKNPIDGLTIDIKTLKEQGVVKFSSAIDAMVNKLSNVAINSASNAKNAVSSGSSYGSSSSVSYSKVSYDKNTDYMAKAQSAISKGDYASAAGYIAQRNAKIDGEGLSYTKVSVNDVKKAMGYASGTLNAGRGIYKVNENGEETYFTKDGVFHNFSGGEMVFNAEQTRRLYEIANQATTDYLGFKNIKNNNGLDSMGLLQNILNNADNSSNNSTKIDDVNITINNPADFNDFTRKLTNAIRKKTV